MLTFLWLEALPFPPIIENILKSKENGSLLVLHVHPEINLKVCKVKPTAFLIIGILSLKKEKKEKCQLIVAEGQRSIH